MCRYKGKRLEAGDGPNPHTEPFPLQRILVTVKENRDLMAPMKLFIITT